VRTPGPPSSTAGEGEGRRGRGRGKGSEGGREDREASGGTGRDRDKGVASMRQDEAIASSCFRRRQIFVLCSAIRLTSILINIQVATENTINSDVSRYYNYKHSNNL